MEKILSLGLTGKKLLAQGFLFCSARSHLDGHGDLVASKGYSTGSVF